MEATKSRKSNKKRAVVSDMHASDYVIFPEHSNRLLDLLCDPLEFVVFAPEDKSAEAEKLAEALGLKYRYVGSKATKDGQLQIMFEPIDILQAYRVLMRAEDIPDLGLPQGRCAKRTVYAILEAMSVIRRYLRNRQIKLDWTVGIRKSQAWQLADSRLIRSHSFGPVNLKLTAQLWVKSAEKLTVAKLEIEHAGEQMKYMLPLWHAGETLHSADVVFTLPDGAIVSDSDVTHDSGYVLSVVNEWLKECGPVHVLSHDAILKAVVYYTEPDPLRALAKELSENYERFAPAEHVTPKAQFKVVQVTESGEVELQQLDMNPIFKLSKAGQKDEALEDMYVEFEGRRIDLKSSLKHLFGKEASADDVERIILEFDEHNMPDCKPSQVLAQAISTLICMALRIVPAFKLTAFAFTPNRYIVVIGEIDNQEHGIIAKLAEYNIWGLRLLHSELQVDDVFHVQPVEFGKIIRSDASLILPTKTGTYMLRWDRKRRTVKLLFNELITIDDLRRCENAQVHRRDGSNNR